MQRPRRGGLGVATETTLGYLQLNISDELSNEESFWKLVQSARFKADFNTGKSLAKWFSDCGDVVHNDADELMRRHMFSVTQYILDSLRRSGKSGDVVLHYMLRAEIMDRMVACEAFEVGQ